MKKIIIVLFFVLIILILITTFIINGFKNRSPLINQLNLTPIPTTDYQKSLLKPSISSLSPSEIKIIPTIDKIKNQTTYKKILDKITTLPRQEIENLEKLKKQLPYQSDDFDADYSPLVNQFIISKKTPLADEKISQWAKDNNIEDLLANKNLFAITDKPISTYKNTVEDIFQKNKQNKIVPTPTSRLPTEQITPTPTPEELMVELNQNIDAVKNFINALANLGSNIYIPSTADIVNPTTVPQSTPSPSQLPTIPLPTGYPSTPMTLSDLFNEVGKKVGLPPKILEAVMRLECSSTFDLSPEEVALYSQPGNRLPFCTTNLCSATGPMQMSIGVDDRGDTTCPRCGAGFCPNAWSGYWDAVNKYGEYSHSPDPFNIRDNVYAAALKLKTDSQAANSTSWTQEEVYRAVERYHGACTDKYRYDRSGLTNKTYCELIWWYYTNR